MGVCSTRTRGCVCWVILSILGVLSFSGSAIAGNPPADFRLTLQTPTYLDTDMIGDEYVAPGVVVLNGTTAIAPIAVKVTLPTGVSPQVASLPNNANWVCSWSVPQVTCDYQHNLTPSNWQSSNLSILLESGSLPVPGSSPVRATVENGDTPLPGPLVCGDDTPASYVATSDTQCAERVVAHRQSEVYFLPNTWEPPSSAPYEAGTQRQFMVGFQNIGFHTNHTPVTARFLLPPGLTYISHGGQVSWNCNAATPDAQGQLVTCTTPYFTDGMGPSQAVIWVNVDVAIDIPVPGPLKIYGTISNPHQPPPDFELCDDASPPVGCGYYEIPTIAAQLPRMDIVNVSHMPDPFPRDVYGVVTFTLANIGDDVAGTGDFQVALPPGVAYDSINYSSIPGTNCMPSGSPATGQTLACSFSSGLPNVNSYDIALRLVADSSAASPARLVAAVGDSISPGPSLATCSGDPDGIGCSEHFLDLSPWIFCDGLEQIPRVCGQPQLFP